MLLRLTLIISLINFILLLLNGSAIDRALHRSLLIFMILFAVIHLGFLLFNLIQTSIPDKSGQKKKTMDGKGEPANES